MTDKKPLDVAGAFDRDQKRFLDHKHKWAGGEADQTRGIKKRRPAKHAGAFHNLAGCRCRDRDAYCYYCHPHYTFAPKTTKTHKHASDYLDERYSPVDSVYDFEAAILASTLESKYTYSYDAKSGPSDGSQLLSAALAKAVDKHETEIVKQLLKSEYEIVGNEKEDAKIGHSVMVDDFELV